MSQNLNGRAPAQSAPAGHAISLTPSDAVEIGQPVRGLYVGATGDLAVEMASGEAVIFAAVPAGSILPVRVRKVLATGTLASAIVGLV
ncbi:spike base protein, RCAP_Rcc01079 family [Pelagibacterium montanilacus]|uniref:spike base protein, RCAP_Rcc01079 family n=1 Tax=Pelagibacterium montanilacus TaxID=2185280 RepID=UPI000F8E5598|nr:hypothetical protein [Pelagibacterium montanilacus]